MTRAALAVAPRDVARAMSRVAPDDDDARASPTCAVCLARPDARDVALVKACLHAFCASCVTKWAEFTRAGARTRCPLCQASCERVLVRRALDGRALEDGGMQEESLCLLRRARWATRGREGEGWDDGDEDGRDGSDGSDGSDALEEALMRGRARRLVLGNRKFGRGGFVSNGGSRSYARPTASGRGKEPAATAAAKKKPPKHDGEASASPASSPRAVGDDGRRVSARSTSPGKLGPKSAKRAESKQKKQEKEAAKAAARLRRREEEHAAKEAQKAALAAKALEALELAA